MMFEKETKLFSLILKTNRNFVLFDDILTSGVTRGREAHSHPLGGDNEPAASAIEKK